MPKKTTTNKVRRFYLVPWMEDKKAFGRTMEYIERHGTDLNEFNVFALARSLKEDQSAALYLVLLEVKRNADHARNVGAEIMRTDGGYLYYEATRGPSPLTYTSELKVSDLTGAPSRDI